MSTRIRSAAETAEGAEATATVTAMAALMQEAMAGGMSVIQIAAFFDTDPRRVYDWLNGRHVSRALYAACCRALRAPVDARAMGTLRIALESPQARRIDRAGGEAAPTAVRVQSPAATPLAVTPPLSSMLDRRAVATLLGLETEQAIDEALSRLEGCVKK